MEKLKFEIFGAGCKNCIRLAENAGSAAEELKIKHEIVKVTDQEIILDRGVFSTPALAINGKIVSSGKVLSTSRIKKLLE